MNGLIAIIKKTINKHFGNTLEMCIILKQGFYCGFLNIQYLKNIMQHKTLSGDSATDRVSDS